MNRVPEFLNYIRSIRKGERAQLDSLNINKLNEFGQLRK